MPRLDFAEVGKLNRSLLDLIESAPLPKLNDCDTPPSVEMQTDAAISEWGVDEAKSKAGIYLLVGLLDRSHSISQEIQDADGSYWHGIMHRMEGDYWNAKYWMRRAPHHPVRQRLVEHIQAQSDQLIQSTSSSQKALLTAVRERLNSAESVSESLIDLVALAVSKQTDWIQPLRVICWWEWQLLFFHPLNR